MSEEPEGTKSSETVTNTSTYPYIGRMRRAGFPVRHLECNLLVEAVPAWTDTSRAIQTTLGKGSLSVIIGPRGTGKTQMAVAIAERWEAKLQVVRGPSDNARARYTTAVELFVTIKETYGDNAQRSERAAIDLFVKPDLLVIDEVQERAGTEWEQRLLAAIVDRRYAAMKDTILVGNLKPEDVQRELGTSIASRAQETGGIYVADWPSFRAKPKTAK